MATVSPIGGIAYGFRLLGYGIAVLLVGSLLVAIGVGMISSGSSVGGVLLAAFGGLALYAGVLGMGYKVIADGVERGVRAARADAGEPQRR